jgi:hypothetical protein
VRFQRSHWWILDRVFQCLLSFGLIVAAGFIMFLVFWGIDWLIKSLPSPKIVYIFFFWFQLIFCLLVILLVCKQQYKGEWGTKLVIIVMLIGGYIIFLGPMVIDIPNLLMGQYESVEGQPEKVWKNQKSFTHHVYIGGKDIEFFMGTKMREKENRQKYYHVEYLHHSKYAIDIKEIEK